MKKLTTFTICMLALFAVNAQWGIDSLNTPGAGLLYGNTETKAVFINGTEWNVYDVLSNTHTTGLLSFSRNMIDVAEAGEKVYFAGGKYGYFADPVYTKNVDVYNAATNTWSTLMLSKAREVGGAGAAGNKVVFAGGSGRDFGGPVYLYNKVDIFDITTGARTTSKLSKARSNIAVGAAGDKIVFAGGWYWDMMYNILQSNVVDIYNVSTGTWTKTALSKKRENIAVAVVGNKIIFAGGAGGAFGGALKNVDIYDAATNTWTTSMLPVPRYGMKSAVAGNLAFFAGGVGGAINSVGVFNTTTNTWSTITIPVVLTNFSMNSINGEIYFAGGFDEATATFSDLIQIYDPIGDSWSYEYLSQPRTMISALTVGSFGVFAGGIKSPPYPVTYSNRVDFYEAPLRYIGEDLTNDILNLEISVFPNPAADQMQIVLNDNGFLPVTCVIYDRLGRIAMSFDLTEPFYLIDVADLSTGNYILTVDDNKGNHAVKTFIKQ